ncbi:hypothetical protein OQA88_10281 [Cercophora sp. LCS_1]
MAQLYTALPSNHIRLLHLQPGTGKVAIETILQTAPLDSTREYEALSYVWGKNVSKKAIRCNGIVVDATKNLVEAMQHLRYPDGPRTLWIDALCINQSDNIEKSIQVMMMGDIYSRAMRTIIWLRPADHISDIALAFVRTTFDDLLGSPDKMRSEMSELQRELGAGVDVSAIERRLARPKAESQVSTAADRSLLVDVDPDDQVASVTALLQREWWTRVWIIQELCLSKEAVLVCGNSSAPWEAMLFAITELNTIDPEESLFVPPLEAISRYHSLSATRAGLAASTVRPPLLDTLASFRRFRATNPLDKVYALLGVSNSVGVVPDYNLNPKECFEHIARHIIMGSNNLDILDHVVPSYPSAIRETPELHSWAPDWCQDDVADPYIRGTVELDSAPHNNDVENADKDKTKAKEDPILTSQARFDSEGLLVLRGIVIDRIDHMLGPIWNPQFGNAPNRPILPANGISAVISWITFIVKRLLLIPRNIRRVSRFMIYCQSLVEFARLATTTEPTIAADEESQAAYRVLALSMRTFGHPTAEKVADLLGGQEDLAKPKLLRFLRSLKVDKLVPFVYHMFNGAWLFYVNAVDDGEDAPEFVPEGISADACRRPAVTGNGYLCLTPHTCRVGYQVALLRGGRQPYLIRDAGGQRWEVVGPCYFSNDHTKEVKGLWSDKKTIDMVFV